VAGASETWFCYMVRCRDESLYVGIATDVLERVKRHNWGVGAKFTAARRPVTLVWTERQADYAAARRREEALKGWSRTKKLRLIEEFRRLHPSP